ncbi:MAG: circadian clock protein KaiC, partial [Dehalococcoidia bacterium]|nr:circadian clock protein KaiC [Dehalococcoidia bacterium]
MSGVSGLTIPRVPSGIDGFDLISFGGFPRGRTTLVSGTAGSAKTVLAAQFLATGARTEGEASVFVTFEESPADIRRNMISFGWDIAKWEAEGRWAFVDASPQPGDEIAIVGDFDLAALLVRIEHAVRTTKATRVALDSIGAIFTRFPSQAVIRYELFRIAAALREMGVTAVMTAERTEEYGEIARYGVEEFV